MLFMRASVVQARAIECAQAKFALGSNDAKLPIIPGASISVVTAPESVASCDGVIRCGAAGAVGMPKPGPGAGIGLAGTCVITAAVPTPINTTATTVPRIGSTTKASTRIKTHRPRALDDALTRCGPCTVLITRLRDLQYLQVTNV